MKLSINHYGTKKYPILDWENNEIGIEKIRLFNSWNRFKYAIRFKFFPVKLIHYPKLINSLKRIKFFSSKIGYSWIPSNQDIHINDILHKIK